MSPRSRPFALRSGALLLVIAVLAGLRVFGVVTSLGGANGLRDLLSRTSAAQEAEMEGALSPAGDWLLAQRAGGSGAVTFHRYDRALEQAAALRAHTREAAPDLAVASWTLMGPTNIGGRVADVAVDPTHADTVFAATASGGVWKSTDAAVNFTYAWPREITQATGAIAIAPDGAIYVGTGETNPGGGSITWGGTGVYRSKDGGKTWQHVGLPTSGNVGRIAIDPKDTKRVFVAAAGNLFLPGGDRGLFRSTDGGDNWELVLPTENPTTGATDISIDPVNPQNILVGTWDHQRLPTHRRYAGPGSGVYLSKDGGTTWTEATLPGAPAPELIGRIGVAFSASNPSRAYAILANNLAGGAIGVWRSNDGGATWAKTSAAASSLSQSSFGWWFGRIWVDPSDQNHVFVPGVSLVESTNGGDSFTAAAGPHADQHGMAWDPNVDGRVYLGNDGGMYRSDANGGQSWVPAAVQGWTQHYSVDISEQNPNHVVSGLQDNGCNRNYAGGNVGHPLVWHPFALCGDGLQTLISPADAGVAYGCSQYGLCSRGTAAGIAAQGIGSTTSQRRNWWTPLQFDPSNPSVMYYGGNILNRSTNGGQSWAAISPDLTTDPEQQDPGTYKNYGNITTVAAAKSNGNVIYVGTDDGLLWRTADLGANWTLLEDEDDPATPEDENDLPGTWVTRVAVDPGNADVAYATFSGFRSGGTTPHVVRTTDGGATWANMSGNLPAAPVNDAIVLPGGKLAVATDVGVFLTSDGGVTWLTVGSNLPAVPVLDIRYHQGTNTITAATFGHGIQRVTLP